MNVAVITLLIYYFAINSSIIKPGNLKFRDFFVPGLGLTVVVLVVSMIGVPLIWSL